MNMKKSVGLGESFTHTFDLFTNDEDENELFYYLAVEYTGAGTPGTPNFRVACLNALGYLDEEAGFLINTPPGSLSDLAVVPNALTVGEFDSVFEEVSATSSRGSATAPSIQKPDIVAPGIVSNWAVSELGFVSEASFNGTSASSAHAAGLVALMQGHRLDHGLPLLSPAMVKAWLTEEAVDVEDVGFDFLSGHGLAIVPSWVMVNAPNGALLKTPAQPLVIGDPVVLNGVGFTAGSRILLFVATATGPQNHGPFTPTSWTPTTLTWNIPANIPLGNGFGTLLVVNTDENFVQSGTPSQLLYGDPTANIPTIHSIAGTALRPVDPTIPTANVETIIEQGTTITITGTGFNGPLVNLFTAAGNVGPLSPLPGGSSTSFQITIPANTVTGPGSFQVVNNPYTGNVLSNAVSVPIGDALNITSISQNGSTITVNGAGFSALSVINFFAQSPSGVQNFGGLNGNSAKIPLNIVSENQFTFQKPAGASAGNAYVMVLNPPFIPFASTTGDPQGAFVLN
ncbi:MAG: hypothetical protein FJ144_22640 [Deltaproteobacteria bacterium]|nr:hypothetical protein [Deltaproteobacteria bacterium]